MTVRTQLAYAAAGLTLVLGLLSVLNPMLAARVVGLEVVAGRGLAEVRSIHGALFLTMAGLMVWAVPLRPRTAPLLRTVGILVLGAAAGRAASIAIDGWGGPVNLLLLLGQAFVGGAVVWASFETREAMRAGRARRGDATGDRRRRPPPVPTVGKPHRQATGPGSVGPSAGPVPPRPDDTQPPPAPRSEATGDGYPRSDGRGQERQ